jgi:SH3 domain
MWDSWRQSGEQLPSTVFGDHDGPPWSEDEDLASPVVTSAKHRKNKSNMYGFDHTTRGRSRDREPHPSFMGTGTDGSETYYVSDANEMANGPGGEFITYPPDGTSLGVPTSGNRRDSHFASSLTGRANAVPFEEMSSSPESAGDDGDESFDVDESRYSRDYQFTIASPDEEMHGRAVALFDFARENDNELPLIEGQVILVSYRHGQGWLVAQDPKTGESGLVPEEYVRLLRDIEGGWNGLMNGGDGNGKDSQDEDARTPTQTEHKAPEARKRDPSSKRDASTKRDPSNSGHKEGSGEYYPPVVSTFSTSREDLERWPHHLLGSQVHTPTSVSEFPRRGSEDLRPFSRRSPSPSKRSTEIHREQNDKTPPAAKMNKESAHEPPKEAVHEAKPLSER